MKPVLQALLVADHVYIDAETGKRVIAGTFNRIRFGKAQPVAQVDKSVESESEPRRVRGGMQAGSPYAYISLTDLYGTTTLVLRYVDLCDGKVLLESEFSVECKDPLQTIEMTVPMPRLPTPHSGPYALEIHCEGELLGSHRIIAEEFTNQPGDMR